MSALEEAIEAFAARHPQYAEPQGAWGFCAIATAAFYERLDGAADVRAIRVTGQHYPGREHWASILFDEERPEESTVIDFTLRQFLADVPYPYVGNLMDWYDLLCDGINDYLDVEIRDVDDSRRPVREVWTDSYDREDFEPGPMTYPWHTSLHGATR